MYSDVNKISDILSILNVKNNSCKYGATIYLVSNFCNLKLHGQFQSRLVISLWQYSSIKCHHTQTRYMLLWPPYCTVVVVLAGMLIREH
jgi:hypothetical protein